MAAGAGEAHGGAPQKEVVNAPAAGRRWLVECLVERNLTPRPGAHASRLLPRCALACTSLPPTPHTLLHTSSIPVACNCTGHALQCRRRGGAVAAAGEWQASPCCTERSTCPATNSCGDQASRIQTGRSTGSRAMCSRSALTGHSLIAVEHPAPAIALAPLPEAPRHRAKREGDRSSPAGSADTAAVPRDGGR